MKKELHRKSRKFRIGMLVLLTFIIINSCTKKEVNLQETKPVVSDITLQDGRLVFKDLTTFMDHQEWLHQNQSNPQLIADKNKSLGLKSMTEYYLEGMQLQETDPKFAEYVANFPNVFNKETYDNSIIYNLPHSIIVCYVANKDGVFQIGDQIFRVVADYVYQISNADESKIGNLFLPRDQISSQDVKITPSRAETKNDYGQRTRTFSDTNFRIVSSLIEHVLYGTWYDDIQTNPQHRVLGIWGRAQLNTKSANGMGYAKPVNCPSCVPVTIFALHDEEEGLSLENIRWSNVQVDMSQSYCPAYSRGRYNGQYIYVYWPDALNSTPTFTEPDWTPANEPF